CRRALHQRPGRRGGASGAARRHRQSGKDHRRAARGEAHRHAARPAAFRSSRKCDRQYLYPAGREAAERGADQCHAQDLRQCQPVLDLLRKEISRPAGLFAGLPALEELAPPGKASRGTASMNLWLVLSVNSITFGGLLFLLSAGFSLIFGLMRIPNLTHGSFFMLGAYFGASLVMWFHLDFWLAALLAALLVAAIGGVIERFLLRRLAGAEQAQVLVTLGLSFMIADLCLMEWTGDPISVATPSALRGFARIAGAAFPLYRLGIIVIAVIVAAGLWLLIDKTRLGAMIRAGVDDPQMARVCGIRVSHLFTIVFCLGAALAGFAGMIGAPILSVYPGLDNDMLPLALVVVILGGTGSLLGSLIGSLTIGFLYNFGQALLPELAYFVLFLPMVLILVMRPQGLFGRRAP